MQKRDSMARRMMAWLTFESVSLGGVPDEACAAKTPWMTAVSSAAGAPLPATSPSQNAGRSQMSQALFERAAGGRHTALSAGTTPAAQVHPEVVAVMGELGVDLAGRTPRRLTPELAAAADVVVTMGCGDECPYIPGKRYLDWDREDPAGRSIDEVRTIRDEIRRRVSELLAEL